MTAFDQIVNDRWIGGIKSTLARRWQHEKHPNVQTKNQEKLENNFPNHIFAQIQCTIDDNEEKLNNQHEQEQNGHFVLLKIRQNTGITSRLRKLRNKCRKFTKIFRLTPNEENPKRMTKKFTKSHMKIKV